MKLALLMLVLLFFLTILRYHSNLKQDVRKDAFTYG